MDGVYRRGEFYLRWLQITSSVFFGTRFGRFATQFLIIPFGGAVVIVEGVTHVVDLFNRRGANSGNAEQTSQAPNDQLNFPASFNADKTVTSLGDSSDTTEKFDENTPGQTAADKVETLIEETSGGEIPAEVLPAEIKSPVQPREVIAVTPRNADDAVDQIVERQWEMLSWVLIIGFLLMFLIHVVQFRRWFFRTVSSFWRLTRKILIDLPLKILRLPLVQSILRNRTVIRIRKLALMPCIVSLIGTRSIPWLLVGQSLNWWWTGSIAVLFSMAINSRLGQDAQELTVEWVGNAWYKLARACCHGGD